MINKQLNSVKKFHQAFTIRYNEKPTSDLPREIIDLRYKLMDEENKEYLEAA